MMLSRRHLLLSTAVATAAAVAACGRSTTAGPDVSDPAEPLPPIEDRLVALEQKYDAVVGLYGADLDSDRTVSHRDGDMFAMCSTFKAYLAARVLYGAQQGELRLDDTIVVNREALQPHSPVTEREVGRAVPLGTLCAATLQQSDNAAANLLLARIGGPPAITAFARLIGDERSRLDRWEVDLNSALPGDPRDTSTPRALGGGIRTLLTGTVLDETHRRQLDEWMRGNVTSARSIRAGLPAGWTSADKTGSGDYASTNNVGIAYGPAGERILLSIMTRTRGDDPKAPALQPLIAEVTALVLPVLLGRG